MLDFAVLTTLLPISISVSAGLPPKAGLMLGGVITASAAAVGQCLPSRIAVCDESRPIHNAPRLSLYWPSMIGGLGGGLIGNFIIKSRAPAGASGLAIWWACALGGASCAAALAFKMRD